MNGFGQIRIGKVDAQHLLQQDHTVFVPQVRIAFADRLQPIGDNRGVFHMMMAENAACRRILDAQRNLDVRLPGRRPVGQCADGLLGAVSIGTLPQKKKLSAADLLEKGVRNFPLPLPRVNRHERVLLWIVSPASDLLGERAVQSFSQLASQKFLNIQSRRGGDDGALLVHGYPEELEQRLEVGAIGRIVRRAEADP
ncbi:hypothetical protein EDM54_22355 [Brevibacillus borstelensis]|nr:hypothetical protein EDM54_22355 [Brevibacillus borstelensis]